MENNKLLSMLGLAKKAGKLLQGYESVIDASESKTAVIILVAEDIADGTRKKVRSSAEKNGIEYSDIQVSMKELGEKTGRSAGVLAVTDINFYNGIKKLIST